VNYATEAVVVTFNGTLPEQYTVDDMIEQISRVVGINAHPIGGSYKESSSVISMQRERESFGYIFFPTPEAAVYTLRKCPIVDLEKKQFALAPSFTAGQFPVERTLVLKNVNKHEPIGVIEKAITTLFPSISLNKILPIKYSRSGRHTGSFLILTASLEVSNEMIAVFNKTVKSPSINDTTLERYNQHWNYLSGKTTEQGVVREKIVSTTEELGKHSAMFLNINLSLRKLFEKIVEVGEELGKVEDRVNRVESYLAGEDTEQRKMMLNLQLKEGVHPTLRSHLKQSLQLILRKTHKRNPEWRKTLQKSLSKKMITSMGNQSPSIYTLLVISGIHQISINLSIHT